MDNRELQGDFLLLEFKRLHDEITAKIVNVHTAFRLYVTLVAGSVGAFVVGLTQGLDRRLLLIISGTLSTFLFIVAALGTLILIQGRYGMAYRFRTLQAIREFFLQLDPPCESVLQVVVTKLYGFSSKAGDVFAGLFVVTFSSLASISWLVFGGAPVAASTLSGIAIGAVAGIILLLHSRKVERIIESPLRQSNNFSGAGQEEAA